MKRFVKAILIFLSPFLMAIALYIAFDPLWYIWDYEDYAVVNHTNNEAYNSYKLLWVGDSIPYNSFIVGSSRSENWPWQVWEKYLDNSARAFHLNSNADDVYQAHERIAYVCNHIDSIKNILLIVDAGWLNGTVEKSGLQYRTPWQMKEERDWIAFQYAAIQHFFSLEGLSAYFKVGKKYRTVLSYYHDERNEPHFLGKEEAIQSNPEYYYNYFVADKSLKFYKRDSIEQIGTPTITDRSKELLEDIYQLLRNKNANCIVVVSPLYDQIKLHPKDKNLLCDIFGDEHVYDFSGVNEYTTDTLNYYEASHYRPRVAIQILKEIYQK